MGLRLAAGPVLRAHRLTGYVPRAFRYPFEADVSPRYEASARTWFSTRPSTSTCRRSTVRHTGHGFRHARLPTSGRHAGAGVRGRCSTDADGQARDAQECRVTAAWRQGLRAKDRSSASAAPALPRTVDQTAPILWTFTFRPAHPRRRHADSARLGWIRDLDGGEAVLIQEPESHDRWK
jgi:hypothetical protein